MYIDESLFYAVLERKGEEAFQALWISIHLGSKKDVICGIIYRQHNSPQRFQQYFDETCEKYAVLGKPVYIMGDFNIDLLKTETSNFSHNFLWSLQSYYLMPTIDKPTRVHNNSATLIDNIFVTNPQQCVSSGNIISDLSDRSLFTILYFKFCYRKGKSNSFQDPKTTLNFLQMNLIMIYHKLIGT